MWLACSNCWKRRRRAKAAEVDKSKEKEEVSAMLTRIKLIEKERRKAMSRKMIREKSKKGKKIGRFRLRKKF